MGDLEKVLLEYYHSIPYHTLSEQEKGEYILLLVKKELEAWRTTQEASL